MNTNVERRRTALESTTGADDSIRLVIVGVGETWCRCFSGAQGFKPNRPGVYRARSQQDHDHH